VQGAQKKDNGKRVLTATPKLKGFHNWVANRDECMTIEVIRSTEYRFPDIGFSIHIVLHWAPTSYEWVKGTYALITSARAQGRLEAGAKEQNLGRFGWPMRLVGDKQQSTRGATP
jgi:hypothetical protein